MNSSIDISLDSDLTLRLGKRVDLYSLREDCGIDVVIAGGSLRAETPNDFDVYSASSDSPLNLADIELRLRAKGWDHIATTANAMTMKDPDGRIFQFCKYAKKTPLDLVSSFDFAHCQVGLVIRASSAWHEVNTEAVFTPEYVKYMALQTTAFIGSEYPLASLCRLPKYVKRGLLPGRSYIHEIMSILTSIISRGFKSYEDFKDQLDAIDLAYSEDNAYSLWKAIEKRMHTCDAP